MDAIDTCICSGYTCINMYVCIEVLQNVRLLGRRLEDFLEHLKHLIIEVLQMLQKVFTAIPVYPSVCTRKYLLQQKHGIPEALKNKVHVPLVSLHAAERAV